MYCIYSQKKIYIHTSIHVLNEKHEICKGFFPLFMQSFSISQKIWIQRKYKNSFLLNKSRLRIIHLTKIEPTIGNRRYYRFRYFYSFFQHISMKTENRSPTIYKNILYFRFFTVFYIHKCVYIFLYLFLYACPLVFLKL